MKTNPRITESEWRIMELLWTGSPRTAKEIHEHLEDTGWNIQTIKTFLARLVDKKAIDYRIEGRSYLYTPKVTKEQCVAVESRNFLSRIFGGSLHVMVSNLMENQAISQEELSELRKLLEAEKEEPK